MTHTANREFRLVISRKDPNRTLIKSDNVGLSDAVRHSTNIGGSYLRFAENSVTLGTRQARLVADELVAKGWTERR